MAKYDTCLECGSVDVEKSTIQRDDSATHVWECEECGNFEEAFTAAAPVPDLMDSFDTLYESQVKELRG